MERYVCIHGHFYQPPRENPSLEAVELQDSAYPYHDWNERITAQCYGPNGASRVLDGEGRIVKIQNNYAKMSFNIGPTLLSWMAAQSPETYQSILAADKESQERFSGHGSALAQAYNHMIMPLATPRDKRTQVLWGIADFTQRFGRAPEGLWLPETAVDLETLDIMAEQGVRFTILAQHQAARVRPIDGRVWRNVAGGQIDPSMAYAVKLPSGRQISLFFYDGAVSRAVAFDGLLDKGDNLVNRLLGSFSDGRSWPQLVHIATDGESYGHHHRHGDMALAYALHQLESHAQVRLTNYGEYLASNPPAHEVELFENSAWSCAHGVERWRSDCGCNSGGHPGWNQGWRRPLREAFDWLRDRLADGYERKGRRLLSDPWAARDEYISVILDRSPENVERFVSRHARRPLNEGEKVAVLKLLELQRHAMLMYTSCGWFFDELSGIETVQVIQYAGRALQLAPELSGEPLEDRFRALLEQATSNIAEHRDGGHIYEQWVKPALIDLKQVGAHYAMSSLFDNYRDRSRIYCYTVQREDYRLLPAGKVRLAVGKAKITSEITHASESVTFGVLHLGDHNLSGGVRQSDGHEAYEALVQDIAGVFGRGDLTEIIREVDRHFGSNSYSLKLLFHDEQRRILRTIMDSTLSDAEAFYRQLHEHHAPMMRFLSDLGAPPPKAWQAAAEVVINARLRRGFEDEDLKQQEVAALLDEAAKWQLTLDSAGLAYVLRHTIQRMIERLQLAPADVPRLQKIEQAVAIALSLPFEVDLWKVQNVYYEMLQKFPAALQALRGPDRALGQDWIDHFTLLGEKLGVRVGQLKEDHMKQVANVVAIADQVALSRRVPTATYRLQFNDAFTFHDANALIGYLNDLGISDCYASPLFKARAGSTHGYDVCDYGRLNPALGGDGGFEQFVAALRERGMGIVLDMVPNHMAINDACNGWWMDVLENGPSSIYAAYFDLDWQPMKPELKNKVLLPILGDQYGKVLENGGFRLAYEDGSFYIQCSGTTLPVAPRTYISILSYQLRTLVQALGNDSEQVRELQSILTALSYLPTRTELSAEKIAERNREKQVIKGRLSTLYASSAYVRAAIDSTVQAFNGTIGNSGSFDLLDALLNEQAHRPAFWRVAAEEINYRRFFDINELAAIRVELPEVFHATHQLVFRLLAEGKLSGLRIDHPDGLWNPRSYFRLLQQSYVLQGVRARLGVDQLDEESNEALMAWLGKRIDESGARAGAMPLYVVAEKILSEGEKLPADWAVDGTTGYDFLNALNGIFVDGRNCRAFDQIYERFIGSTTDFHSLTNSTRKMIMLVSLASEVNALSHQLERIAEKNRLFRDFTLNSLTFAIREVIAALQVYRTYITGSDLVGQHDEGYVESAVAEAKRRNPRTATAIFDFIRDTLLLRNVDDFAKADRAALVDFVMKFQQITGPVMAKGVEDTAFYVYNRLVSLNEVGGHPSQFGQSVATFHRQNVERQRQWPHSLVATSTHDSKRSEDVRARINVLSEIPKEWQAAVTRWSSLNEAKKSATGAGLAPDRNDEYLLYQTLLGTWPDGAPTPKEREAYRHRIAAYMEKATKEAKVHTSWVNPNDEYDAAVRDFVLHVLADEDGDSFIADLLPLQRRVAFYGRYNSLFQTLLKLTAPGVPDIYQGNEIWDYSLVDPDNRRPVDFQRRAALLRELRDRLAALGSEPAPLARELLDAGDDGRIKLYLTYRTLEFRCGHQPLFKDGSYLPLAARGGQREHVCAFARSWNAETILVIVPRLVVGLTTGVERPPIGTEIWQDTHLVLPTEYKGYRFRNVLTGEVLCTDHAGGPTLLLAQALFQFPVALLARVAE